MKRKKTDTHHVIAWHGKRPRAESNFECSMMFGTLSECNTWLADYKRRTYLPLPNSYRVVSIGDKETE